MSQNWEEMVPASHSGGTMSQASFDAGLRKYMLSIYNYMAGGVAVTGVLAWIVGSGYFPALTQAVLYSPLKWVLMIAPLGIVLAMNFGVNRMSRGTLMALFVALAAAIGLSMGSIFLVFTHGSIARAFFISAALFGTMSLYGYTTRRALDGLGGFMLVGLIGLIIASVVNLLFPMGWLQFAVSCIAVIVFTGLTAWDTQRLKEVYSAGYGDTMMGKIAILGALSLYLNFVNIFQALLNLLGNRD